MKLNNTPLFVFCLLSFITFSQTEINDHQMKWTKGWTNFAPNITEYPEHEEVLSNIINQDVYLTNDVTYLMSGNLYIVNNATLTIQEGTIIRCDTENPTSLVVTKGSKLIASGTKGAPIVFTSNKAEKTRKPGDWGGILIAGASTINAPAVSKTIEGDFLPHHSSYAGTQSEEQTTILTYVRIEYAGKKINESKELNGLSLYAVGSNSIVNNIMISYSADDSFECYGGNVDMYNLISYKAKDDDFDFTLGYKGELNNILAVRHPYISDISGSYAIEIDGYNKADGYSNAASLSNVRVKNATFVNLSDQSNYQHTIAAISTKNLAILNIVDSRISGFANVAKFDNTYRSYTDIQKKFSFENGIFNIHSTSIITQSEIQVDTDPLLKYNMHTNAFRNVKDIFTDPFNEKNPKFTLKESENYTVMQ